MWFTSFFVMLFFPLSESDKAPDYKIKQDEHIKFALRAEVDKLISL